MGPIERGTEVVDILGTRISRKGFAEVLAACRARVIESQAGAGQGGYVCFANVHSVTDASSQPEIQSALNGAFLAVADGVPLVWVSRLKSQPIGSRVCGPDFMKAFLTENRDLSHGFIGGTPGQAERLAEIHGISAVCYSPPVRGFSPGNAREDWETFLKLCPGGKPPAVVWVGLGAPKQELWMHAVSSLAPTVLFFGVGAAFDFLTGSKSRAPLWMQESGLEWLYRLGKEPRRLWRRYLVNNSVFIGKVSRDLVQGGGGQRGPS